MTTQSPQAPLPDNGASAAAAAAAGATAAAPVAQSPGSSAPARGSSEVGAPSLEALYDLTLPVSIELGRTRMTVQDVLALGRGSVVQLERLVGEPVDVYVADRHFAAGEVVVMGEQFGVRVTRIFKSGAGDED